MGEGGGGRGLGPSGGGVWAGQRVEEVRRGASLPQGKLRPLLMTAGARGQRKVLRAGAGGRHWGAAKEREGQVLWELLWGSEATQAGSPMCWLLHGQRGIFTWI